MDELSLLRQIRSDAPEPQKAALDRGRAALLQRAVTDIRPNTWVPARTRRRGVRWVGLSALGAGALTVALIASNVLGVAGWRGGAEAAAADVLKAAALASIENSDPAIAPGQFLLVETDAVYGSTLQRGAGDYVSWLTISHDKLYVPADRSDEWIWSRSFREPYTAFSAEGELLAQQKYQNEFDQADGKTELLRAPSAEFYGNSVVPDFDSLPTDPQELLNHIYTVTAGGGQSVDGAALEWIADTLRTGVVPVKIRAALYQAVAGIPGVKITDQAANLQGRVGVAIGRVESADNSRQDLIIDKKTGALIGERLVNLSKEWGFPAGTITSFTAVHTSVVDTPPDGGTPNGRFDGPNCTDFGNGQFQC